MIHPEPIVQQVRQLTIGDQVLIGVCWRTIQFIERIDSARWTLHFGMDHKSDPMPIGTRIIIGFQP